MNSIRLFASRGFFGTKREIGGGPGVVGTGSRISSCLRLRNVNAAAVDVGIADKAARGVEANAAVADGTRLGSLSRWQHGIAATIAHVSHKRRNIVAQGSPLETRRPRILPLYGTGIGVSLRNGAPSEFASHVASPALYAAIEKQRTGMVVSSDDGRDSS